MEHSNHDSILHLPWKQIKIGEQNNYLYKCLLLENSYHLLVTDLVYIWEESVVGVDIMSRCRSLNPQVEAPQNLIVKHILKLLEKDNDCTLQLRKVDESKSIVISATSLLAGMPFIWKFEMQDGGCDLFSQHVTIPLVLMVAEMQCQQKELYQLLNKKDCEIKDYKFALETVPSRQWEAPVFDKGAFETKHVMCNVREVLHLGLATQLAQVQSLYQNVVKQAHIFLDNECPSTFRLNDILGDTSQIIFSQENELGASSPIKSQFQDRSSDKGTVIAEKDEENERRQALEKKLAEEKIRKEAKKVKQAKKKKLNL